MADLASHLTAWARTQHRGEQAAVELLVADGYWLNVQSFTSTCIHRPDTDQAWIDWREVRTCIEQARVTTHDRRGWDHLAVLDLACSLATDRYRLLSQWPETRERMLRAVCQTVSAVPVLVAEPVPAGGDRHDG